MVDRAHDTVGLEGGTARLQLRWEKAPEGVGQFGYRSWLCHYELVLPLREHDVRREDEDGNDTRSELVIAIKPPTVRGSDTEPCRHAGTYYFDPPYRDGAHALWDAKLLGNLPIVVIATDGTVIPRPSEAA